MKIQTDPLCPACDEEKDKLTTLSVNVPIRVWYHFIF